MKENMYTVIWKKEARKMYGVSSKEHGIIPLDDDLITPIKVDVSLYKTGRPRYRNATVFPIFTTKCEAEAYRDGNDDWETVDIKIEVK